MANPLIQLLDSESEIVREPLMTALRGVSFLSHQFDWFIAEIKRKPVPDAVEMLVGYCGVKKRTPARDARLDRMVRTLQAS